MNSVLGIQCIFPGCGLHTQGKMILQKSQDPGPKITLLCSVYYSGAVFSGLLLYPFQEFINRVFFGGQYRPNRLWALITGNRQVGATSVSSAITNQIGISSGSTVDDNENESVIIEMIPNDAKYAMCH